METSRLTSMTDFVLEQRDKFLKCLDFESSDAFEIITKYAKFLKQLLKMSMFVPTDDEGNILEKPDKYDSGLWHQAGKFKIENYRKAKEKVLFKGFEVIDYYAQYTGEDEMIYIDEEFCENMTIEKFLTTIISEIELTKSALKQIGIYE